MVATTPAANYGGNNTGGKFATGGNSTCDKEWEQYQAAYLHLKVNRRTIYLYVNSTTERFPNKIFKTFLIEVFFLFVTGVNDSGGAH